MINREVMDMGTEEVWGSDPYECTKKGTESCTHACLDDFDEIRDVTVTKTPFNFMPADTIMDTYSNTHMYLLYYCLIREYSYFSCEVLGMNTLILNSSSDNIVLY